MAWEDHEGLAQQTIPFYQRKRFVNISNQKQYYTAFPALMGRAQQADLNKLVFGLPEMTSGAGGTQFVFNVQVSKGTTFAAVDETTPVNVQRKDHQRQVTLPWRMFRTHYSWNKRELTANRGDEEITSIQTSRSLGMDQEFADGLEDWFWGTVPPSTDELTPFPLRYWVFNAVESTATSYATAGTAYEGNGDFLNLNHASYTSGPGALSRVTYKYWGNYNFQRTSAFNDALVDKIGHAVLKTGFHSPVDFPDKMQGPPDRAMYMGAVDKLAHAKLARQQNDQNTSDTLARFTDTEALRVPSYYVPALDSRTDYPIYGINWASWYLATKDQYRMIDQVFDPDRSAPMDFTLARWLETQLVCCYPRENWVTTT